ncbi:MAG: Rne/Rng family ribonuclease [Clostridiales bacterium]|nr:Rne/Rng family ribonuclease [Clostridiales bacterium]
MKKNEAAEIYIDIDKSGKACVALVEGGNLAEYYIERRAERRILGNIYKGVVVNVLHGMQAAFIDIGLSRNAFLYVGDISIDRSGVTNPENIKMPERLTLRAGDMIMVQVVKEESGAKGARVTSNISLAGRLVVMTPTLNFVGVSRKIPDEKTRGELEKTVLAARGQSDCGYIVRTAAAETGRRAVVAEMRELSERFDKISADYVKAAPKEMVFNEGNLVFRTVRDMIKPNVQRIYTNDAATFGDMKIQMKTGMADYIKKLELYADAKEMFTAFGLHQKIQQLIDRKVWLKSGGYLIIDKTEALTVIDVNSGRYSGGAQLEDTVFSVNLEAAEEIAHVMRRRNIGGIVIVDFIDMALEEHRASVLERLGEFLSLDRTKTKIAGMTQLGLVEITRKKTRNDISYDLTEPCPYCGGDGFIHSSEYVASRLKYDLQEIFRLSDPPAVTVTVSPSVKERLFSGLLSRECETIWALKRIYIVADENLHCNKYRIQIEKDTILTLADSAKLLY